jgi:DNA-binding transcriptional regulator YhcF (GntR family)
MILAIDFNSSEAIYLQLCNQIIMQIAAEEYREGDTLPSVRQLAENIGINMHTVNKAYAVLKQEGFLKLDRRKGAVVSLNADKCRALEDMNQELRVVLAKARCKSISRQEVHTMVDQIYYDYLGGNPNAM